MVRVKNADEETEGQLEDTKASEAVVDDSPNDGSLSEGSNSSPPEPKSEGTDSEAIATEETDTVNEMPPSNEEGGEDADKTDEGSPDLHEHRS